MSANKQIVIEHPNMVGIVGAIAELRNAHFDYENTDGDLMDDMMGNPELVVHQANQLLTQLKEKCLDLEEDGEENRIGGVDPALYDQQSRELAGYKMLVERLKQTLWATEGDLMYVVNNYLTHPEKNGVLGRTVDRLRNVDYRPPLVKLSEQGRFVAFTRPYEDDFPF